MNLTDFDKNYMECFFKYRNASILYKIKNITFCPPVYDGVKCWPPIEGGEKTVQQCPHYFSGYNYNIYGLIILRIVIVIFFWDSYQKSKNAEKYCYLNGTWQTKTNYDPCYRLSQEKSVLFWLYIIGYSLSFFSLCSAFVIFNYFKTLRCLRNIIHCNLVLSFIIRVSLWTSIYASGFSKPYPQIVSNVLFALFIFSQLANFFWMFVEGLYLFIVIVWTYRIEKVKILHFALIGWAVPVWLTSFWVIVMITQGIDDWVAYRGNMKLIVHLPIIIILVINLAVLIFLIITLVKKLKATTNTKLLSRKTNHFGPLTTEYKKALKSTVVLMPLLGFTHIIFICNPPDSQFTVIFNISNAVLSSSQGFWVSLIYCFFNGEVRTALRNYICGQFQNNMRLRQTFINIPSQRQSVPLFNQQISDTYQTSPYNNHKQIVSLMQKLRQSKDIHNRMINTRRVRSQINIRESSDISLM